MLDSSVTTGNEDLNSGPTAGSVSMPSWSNTYNNNRERRPRPIITLLFGQLIALLAATMNVTSFVLVKKFEVGTQFFQLFWVYLLLSTNLFWSNPPLHEDDEDNMSRIEGINAGDTRTTHRFSFPGNRRLLVPWWIYLLMSILDVVPNYFALLSYRFTSLTSTTLLGSLTVPSTMFFTRIFLSKTFGMHQYGGVVLCVLGGALTVYKDASNFGATNSTVGDVLAVVAAIVYGLGDAVAEYSVKRMDRFEYLGMLGLFGMVLTFCSIMATEYHSVLGLVGNPNNHGILVLTFLSYIFSVLFYYVSATKFLVSSDATLLNLSLQTVNLWAMGFAWLTKTEATPSPLFFVALLLVVSGVLLYEVGQEKILGACCSRRFWRCRARRPSEAEMVPSPTDTMSCPDDSPDHHHQNQLLMDYDTVRDEGDRQENLS